MPKKRERITTQIDSALLSELQALARRDDRGFDALIEEALRDLLRKRQTSRPREHVMSAYRTSLERYTSLYRWLAR